MSELAELVGGALCVVERLAHQRRRVTGVTFQLPPGELERDHGVDEALLRPIVQVAHYPPPLLVTRGHDPRPRRGELHPGLDVRDREGDQLGELPDPELRVGGSGRLRRRPSRPTAARPR